MNSSYEASRIADGFAQLANIFMPNTGAVIEADMNRRKAENITADTNRTNVDATRLAADRDRLLSQRAVIEQQRQAAVELADIFASGADLSDPLVRGRAAAAVAQMENGLQYGPAGLTGLTTYTDPQFVPDNEDFSRIILGTGVVNDYANTPRGFMDAETNDLIANDEDNASLERRKQMELDNDTALAKAGVKGGKAPNPLDVTPETSTELADMLASNIQSNFGVSAENVDPKLMTDLLAETAQAYQNRENAAVAIQDVLSGLTTDADGNLVRAADVAAPQTPPPANAKGGGTGMAGAVDAALLPFLSVLSPGLAVRTAQQGQGGGQPAAAPQSGAAPTQGQPLTAVGPNGERIMLDPATNQWVPVGPRRGP